MHNLANPECKESILRRLRNVRAESHRRWGKMSAPQMICHLIDSFRSMMGEKPIRTLRYRTAIKWPALYLPIPWPKGFKTRPEVDQLIGGTKPSDFSGDVDDLVGLLDRFVSPTPDFTFQPHPIFGPLSAWQWMRWGYLHMDHHLRQFGE